MFHITQTHTPENCPKEVGGSKTLHLEKARQFVQSEDLRQTMQRSSVYDQPDVYFLDEIERVAE